MIYKNKVLHIITSLGNGGAEGVLYRICKADKKNVHIVISLMKPSKYSSLLDECGIKVIHLNALQGKLSVRVICKLYKAIKDNAPDVVQTWMYHSDFIGGITARLAGVKRVFWNVRHTSLEPGKAKKTTFYIAKSCAFLSYIIPNKIICCAEEALKEHIRVGYNPNKMFIIENGYNLELFKKFEQKKSTSLFGDLNTAGKPLLGMIGRYTPEKDHNNLLNALHFLDGKGCDFFLVLAGTGIDSENKTLLDLVYHYKLNKKVMLLGPVSDIPLLMNHLDMHVLSSSSEGFPNVLAEAMACGTPCISTMAGAAERIIGDTGWLVPISSPEKLADAIHDAILEFEQHNEKWNERRMIAEQRIKDNFSIDVMVDKYNEVWSS